MAVSVQQGGGTTAYTNTDWKAYTRGRPPYAKSLVGIIYQYRQRQPGAVYWERIVDIGSGNGIAASHFAREFDIIHLSDPAETNLESDFLPAYLAQNGIDAKIETSQSRGEEAHKHIGENKADLLICATAAHYMDPDGLVASAGRILKPGGTLAIFTYLYPHFASTELNHEYWSAISELVYLIRQRSPGPLNAAVELGIRNLTAGDGGLDSIPIPDDLYTDKIRIAINSSRGQFLFDGYLAEASAFPGESLGAGPSRISENEKRLVFESGKDPEADGWEYEVDREFLDLFAGSLRPIGNALTNEEFSKIFEGFDKTFKKECPSGKVTARWPVKLILATRK